MIRPQRWACVRPIKGSLQRIPCERSFKGLAQFIACGHDIRPYGWLGMYIGRLYGY